MVPFSSARETVTDTCYISCKLATGLRLESGVAAECRAWGSR